MINKFLFSILLLHCCMTFSMHILSLPKDIQNLIFKYLIEDNKIDAKVYGHIAKDPRDEDMTIRTLNIKISTIFGNSLQKKFQNDALFTGLIDNKFFFNPKTLDLTFSITSQKCERECYVCENEHAPYAQKIISYVLGKEIQKTKCIFDKDTLHYVYYEKDEYIILSTEQPGPGIMHRKDSKDVSSFFTFSHEELELINFKKHDTYSENHLKNYLILNGICKKPDPS